MTVTFLCLFRLIRRLNAKLYTLLSQELSYLTFVNEKDGFCNVKNQNPCKIFVLTYLMHAVSEYSHSMCVFVGYITQAVRRLWFFRADLICAARWTTSHSSGAKASCFIRRWAEMIYCQSVFDPPDVCAVNVAVFLQRAAGSVYCAALLRSLVSDSLIQFWTIETHSWL